MIHPAPARPRQHAENVLLEAILDGEFPPGSALPGERTLSAQLGVARPALREAIQRLARDGWLTVAHGKATLVNDFWQEGGLNVLSKLVEHPQHLPPDFIEQLLEVRLQMAPAYTRAAVERAGSETAAFLATAPNLERGAPVDFAHFDWQLHHLLTVRSGNPIYTLILNGFRGFYQDVARRYFAPEAARRLSARFYSELRATAEAGDAAHAERLCRDVMRASIAIWRAAGRDDMNDEIERRPTEEE
jgi:GntR family negative regulator for fad regulon and positive regulator of fabA